LVSDDGHCAGSQLHEHRYGSAFSGRSNTLTCTLSGSCPYRRQRAGHRPSSRKFLHGGSHRSGSYHGPSSALDEPSTPDQDLDNHHLRHPLKRFAPDPIPVHPDRHAPLHPRPHNHSGSNGNLVAKHCHQHLPRRLRAPGTPYPSPATPFRVGYTRAPNAFGFSFASPSSSASRISHGHRCLCRQTSRDRSPVSRLDTPCCG
jgi:hypothetical protein